jgi:hypothetical protein
MQTELDATPTPTPIRIFGVNVIGSESGNETITLGRTLPWLQETPEMPVWTTWAVTYRDVVILDEENHRIDAFNLTTNDLGNPAHYEALKTLLLDAAR